MMQYIAFCFFALFFISSSTSTAFTMKKIRSIQARVQGDEPLWDEKLQKYRSTFGDWLSLNTVNTASVEGALMYVQAECVNYFDQSVRCRRKNNAKYIVMYDIEIVQPMPALNYHNKEFGPFVAMDGNKCTPTHGENLPDTCNRYYGLNNQPALGPYVGGSLVSTDPRAKYPDNYWFSYPNSCPTMHRNKKTKQCIAKYPGGMCTGDETLDGKQCTYTYKILGYISIDELVGITSMKNTQTGENFKDLKEFCEAGKIEFYAERGLKNFKSDLEFWNEPEKISANQERSQRLINAYNALAGKEEHMKSLPKMEELTKENPPCYENVKACAASRYGCKRKLLAQVCKVCNSADVGCVKAPAGFKFPDLSKPTPVTTPKPTSATTPKPTPRPTSKPSVQPNIPMTSPKTTPQTTPTTTPKITPESTSEAAPETTSEAMSKAAPTTTPKTTPESTPDTTPETTPEAAPETTSEAMSKAAPTTIPKTTPESTPDTTPEAASKAAPTTTPKPSPESTPETTSETASEAMSKAAPTTIPKTTSKSTPETTALSTSPRARCK